ncbi:hypothetical protein O203_17725 [Ectopseudomonas chengduensis]|nr:hypothetical protein O203_17725 [Pseudomonas chengduensis]
MNRQNAIDIKIGVIPPIVYRHKVADQHGTRVILHPAVLQLNFFRMPTVIRVEESDITSLS